MVECKKHVLKGNACKEGTKREIECAYKVKQVKNSKDNAIKDFKIHFVFDNSRNMIRLIQCVAVRYFESLARNA